MSKGEEYICKGFIIPKRGKNDEPIYALEFTRDDRNKLYDKYKQFLEEFIQTYITINGKGKIKDVNDIRYLLDALIFYLRSILIIDPIPKYIIEKIIGGKAKDHISSPTALLKCLIINEFRSHLDRNIDKIEEFENIIYKINGKEKIKTVYIKQLSKLDDLASKLLEDPSILDFPADTRPGSNTSSLILHMLTVSAIAISIYMYRNANVRDEDIQILRLVALFHDIGKIKDWYYHKSESAKFLSEIFKDKTEGEAKEIIEKAVTLIKEKEDDELYKIFKSADKIASASDRMPFIVSQVLKDSQLLDDRLKEDIYKRSDDWEFWKQFTLDQKKELTEEFCKNVSNIEKIIELLEQTNELSNEIFNNEIYIARLDFKGIQSFIKSNNLKVMNGASRLVDLAIFTILPFILCYRNRIGLYPENILYNGGGNITIVIPANKEKELKDFIDKDAPWPVRGNIRYVGSYLYKSFIKTNKEIDDMLACDKLKVCEEGKGIDYNLYELCKSCGNKAIVKVSSNYYEEEKEMCKECQKKFREGDNYHFKYKINMLKLVDNNDDKDKLLKNILEYIAGHDIEEIKSGIQEYKDMALIKFDSNLMGQLMASSISLTDAFERSIRIDYSIKQAFLSFLNKLIDKKLDKYAKRIIMGLQYIGGDDGLIIVPSTISVPFALHIINEYYLNMGKRSTLSVGIAIAKPKHPIQLLKDGVEYLLNKAKDNARQYSYDIYKYVNKEEFKGALAFYVADGGKINDESLEFIFNKLSEEGLTIQPYLVTTNTNSINRLLNIISNDNSDDLKKYIDLLLSYLDNNEIALKKDKREEMKNIRNACLKSIQVNVGYYNDLKLKIVYSIKESHDNNLIGNIVKNLLFVEQNGYKFALYDLYMLLKALGVEYE
jgi:HD superfamily phosphodiesterase